MITKPVVCTWCCHEDFPCVGQGPQCQLPISKRVEVRPSHRQAACPDGALDGEGLGAVAVDREPVTNDGLITAA